MLAILSYRDAVHDFDMFISRSFEMLLGQKCDLIVGGVGYVEMDLKPDLLPHGRNVVCKVHKHTFPCRWIVVV